MESNHLSKPVYRSKRKTKNLFVKAMINTRNNKKRTTGTEEPRERWRNGRGEAGRREWRTEAGRH